MPPPTPGIWVEGSERTGPPGREEEELPWAPGAEAPAEAVAPDVGADELLEEEDDDEDDDEDEEDELDDSIAYKESESR